jgi:hypothetical protein
MSEKSAEALKTIGEVAKELNLIELETGKAKNLYSKILGKRVSSIKAKIKS